MIPLWAIKLGAGLALVLAVWGHGYTNGKRASEAKQAAALQAATDAAHAEESRRVMRLQENADAAEVQRRRAEADARGLRDARDGLLLAAQGAGAAACRAASAADGSPARDADVVPADLFRSVEERAERLAGALDGARIAGQLCANAYDALR